MQLILSCLAFRTGGTAACQTSTSLLLPRNPRALGLFSGVDWVYTLSPNELHCCSSSLAVYLIWKHPNTHWWTEYTITMYCINRDAYYKFKHPSLAGLCINNLNIKIIYVFFLVIRAECHLKKELNTSAEINLQNPFSFKQNKPQILGYILCKH